jgi:hypothetical protein
MCFSQLSRQHCAIREGDNTTFSGGNSGWSERAAKDSELRKSKEPRQLQSSALHAWRKLHGLGKHMKPTLGGVELARRGGAHGEIRTHTGLRPEACRAPASTNSATWALLVRFGANGC